MQAIEFLFYAEGNDMRLSGQFNASLLKVLEKIFKIEVVYVKAFSCNDVGRLKEVRRRACRDN